MVIKKYICDICFYETGEEVEAGHRVGHRGGNLKLDVCTKHTDFAKGTTPEQLLKKFLDLTQKSTVTHLE